MLFRNRCIIIYKVHHTGEEAGRIVRVWSANDDEKRIDRLYYAVLVVVFAVAREYFFISLCIFYAKKVVTQGFAA